MLLGGIVRVRVRGLRWRVRELVIMREYDAMCTAYSTPLVWGGNACIWISIWTFPKGEVKYTERI